ncbi:MAG: MarR family transcriptional regulator [Pseudomonadota bacterium]|nr:MarR family transcriptional regulator [Pseudomonadota bacterium]
MIANASIAYAAYYLHNSVMNDRSKAVSPAKKVRETSVGWMLKVLCTSLDEKMNKEMKRLDLNIAQFAVLMSLSETEGLTQVEIGKKINMPGYATTRTIDALEKVQFVERKKDDRSRRSYRIYLTEQGRKIVPQLFVVVKKVNTQLLSTLTLTEKKQLNKILNKIVHAKFE